MSPVAAALIVTEPAVAPVTLFEAIPLDAVAVPRPVTVPVPDVFANTRFVGHQWWHKHGLQSFYGLPPNRGTVTLVREEWRVPQTVAFGQERLVPLRAGETVPWKLA